MPHRLQFSLRTLLVAMLCAAFFFGGMAWQRVLIGKQAAQRDREVKAKYDSLFTELRMMLAIRLAERIDEQAELQSGSQPED